MLTTICQPVRVCLPVCGLLRRNGARLREMADSRVLATTRRIHIRLRVAVLRDSSHFRRFRPASGGEASRAWHPRVLGPVVGRSSLTPGKSASPPARCIHRPQRYTSSADTPPRLARARWRITRAVTAPFPCVRSFRPPPWARPSIRRVFLRSLCARRLIVVSLNNLHPLPRFCKLSYARRKHVAVRL